MKTLILANSTIVAFADTVTASPTGYTTPDGVFPFNAGVTGIATVATLPADFAPNLYEWDGSALVRLPDPPASPPPVPSSVTRRQLLLGLFAGGYITAQEAEAAAATGAVPAILAEVIDAMPEPQAVAARITWASMSVAERSDPMWGAIIAAELATSEQIDDLFRAAATL